MSLEIVIPAHNEQHRIGRTLTAYRSELLDPDLRLTVALDDCTDATAAVVADHAAADHRIRGVEYPRLGKGGVLAEAFRSSNADLVAFVDADCATPPAEVEVLTETIARTGADIAIASRWHPTSVLPKQRTMARRIASAGFARAVKTVFALPFADTQCGAKVLTRQAARRVMPLLSSRDFVFDVDLLVTARALGLRVAEVPTVWIDQDGSRVRVVRDAARMAASLGRLWLHHRIVPVRMPARGIVLEPLVPLSVATVLSPTLTLPGPTTTIPRPADHAADVADSALTHLSATPSLTQELTRAS